jgi:hypothetical protein
MVYGRVVNGEITRCLRDKGLWISVPGRWLEMHVRGHLRRESQPLEGVLQRLGITADRWREICQASSMWVVVTAVSQADESLE